jgi:hypothetical protein
MAFLTTTVAAYTAHNTSANPAYNQTNFPPNFTGTSYVTQAGATIAVNSALSDDSFNPVTPCHVSPVSVKTMTPGYSGKRIIQIEPYDFGGYGSGAPHLNIGVDTDTTAWVSAAMNGIQARGYDGVTIDWYGPGRYEDSVTLLIKSQIAGMSGGFSYALMLDSSGGTTLTTALLESWLAYVNTTYFPDANYRTFGGKKVLYVWSDAVAGVDYATAFAPYASSVYVIGLGPGALGLSWCNAGFDWVQPWLNGVSGTDPYNLAAKGSFVSSAGASSKGSVLTISAGFNGTETFSYSWSKGKMMPRDSGKCWITQAAFVNSHITAAEAGGGTVAEILDVTYNDWEEGTEMEDAIDNGIVVAASLAGSIVSWSVSGGTGDETTISEYILLASPDGINAAVLGTQATGGSKTFDLSTVTGWAAGTTYTIYVIAQGIPNVRTQSNSSISYTPGGSVTLSSIAVTPATASIPSSGVQQFTATGTYSDGSTANITTLVTWSSSATGVATVSNTSGSSGQATGVSAGTATITATLSGKTGTAALTVTSISLTSIVVTPNPQTIVQGTTQQFTATGHYSDSSTANLTTAVTWSSSAPAVAEISITGLATGEAGGSSTLTATLHSISGTSALTVTGITLTSITIVPNPATEVVGQNVPFFATGHYSNGSSGDITILVTWSSSNTAIATISSATPTNGIATMVATGSCTISAAYDSITGTAPLSSVVSALFVTQDCLIYEVPTLNIGHLFDSQDCLIFEVSIPPVPFAYPITLPSTLGPQEFTLALENVAGENDSPFDLSDQVFLWPGDMFTADATWPPMLLVQAEPLISALAMLLGKYGTFLMGDYNRPTPQGPMTGAPVVNGENLSGSNQLLVRGAIASVANWAAAGDYIQVTAVGGLQRIHKVLANATSSSGGLVTLSIRPSIREALADGVTIVTANCQGTFRLASNETPWKIDKDKVYTVSFKAREAELP